jgi:hypothetical protein
LAVRGSRAYFLRLKRCSISQEAELIEAAISDPRRGDRNSQYYASNPALNSRLTDERIGVPFIALAIHIYNLKAPAADLHVIGDRRDAAESPLAQHERVWESDEGVLLQINRTSGPQYL